MITVIVPIYNSEDTVSACIESLVRQSFTDTELILVDDGSTDNSGTICDTYSTKDSRIRVIHQQNKGRSEARLAGVQQSQGQWICFVDSDDMLPVDALNDLYKATTDDTDIVLGNGFTIAPENRTVIPIDDFRHLAVRAEGTIGVPWGSLYRRTIITPYLFDLPRHIINGEDYIFWLRMVFQTDRPVRVVYKSVYNKGAEHTSNSFAWTAAYCYELNEYRKAAIPQDQYEEYLPDMIEDRLANLFAVSVWQSRKEWLNSQFYKDIIDDLKAVHQQMSIKQRLFLAIPSLKLRKAISTLI